MSLSDRQARECVARVESLLERLDSVGDPSAREVAIGSVQGLLELYGEGLARIVGHVAEQCDIGTETRLAAALAGDELVSHLLMLHGLHPEETRRRVEGALDDVRPLLRLHGGNVELVDVAGGTVRLRLQGHCHGCPSSTATLRTTIEDAILAAAPEVWRVETTDSTSGLGDGAPVPLVRARRGGGLTAVAEVSA
jgi:Fe-S cluster biogenesis protein NfuA